MIYWIFIILAVVVALFSGKIDQAANANQKIKKALIAMCAFLALVSFGMLIHLML